MTVSFVHAQQWADASPNIYNLNTGHVGIGTTAPAYPLTVISVAGENPGWFHSNTTGNIAVSVSNMNGQLNLGIGAQTPHGYAWSGTGGYFIGADGNPTVYVDGMTNGNVGIGTTDTIDIEKKNGKERRQVRKIIESQQKEILQLKSHLSTPR